MFVFNRIISLFFDAFIVSGNPLDSCSAQCRVLTVIPVNKLPSVDMPHVENQLNITSIHRWTFRCSRNICRGEKW